MGNTARNDIHPWSSGSELGMTKLLERSHVVTYFEDAVVAE